MRTDQRRGQLLGAPERRKRLLRAASGQLQDGGSIAQAHPGARLRLGAQGALGALQSRLCFIEPSLVEHHDTELGVGDPSERFLAPAVSFRQLDRLRGPCSRRPATAATRRWRERLTRAMQASRGRASRATSSFKSVMRRMFGALPVPKRSAQLTRIW